MSVLYWVWAFLWSLTIVVAAFIGGVYWGTREYIRFVSQKHNKTTWYRAGLLPDRHDFWAMVKWLGRPFPEKKNKGKREVA